MDVNFCTHYTGDGLPPTNRFCRECPEADKACNRLWALVVGLSKSNDGGPVKLRGTRAVMFPNPKNPEIVHLKINCKWNLGKEDFLYFISTGYANMGRKDERHKREVSPSMTRQVPYVRSIVEAIGGYDIPEIMAVREFQGEGAD